MNVYCETNFFLELVFSQEQTNCCEKIISLCRKKKIKLIFPAYSFAEALYKLEARSRERSNFKDQLNSQLSDLTRNSKNVSQIKSFRTLDTFLTQNIEEEKKRFEKHRKTLTKLAEVLAFDAQIIQEARQIESKYNLTLQDSIAFSSILRHLKKNIKDQNLFLNRNSKDFNTIDIKDKLKDFNCKFISSFKDGYSYILSQIK